MIKTKNSCESYFCLTHAQPWLFYGPKCRVPLSFYVAYRILVAAYFAIMFVWNLVDNIGGISRHMIFFSMWAFLLQTVSMCLKMAITTVKAISAKCQRPDETYRGAVYPIRMGCLLQFEWLLHTLSIVLPFYVTCRFWLQARIDTAQTGHSEQWLSVFFVLQVHAINSIFALFDLLLSAIPLQLMHFYQPMLFVITYWTFRYLHYAYTGVAVIYGYSDVTDIKASLTELGIDLLLVMACFLLAWLINTVQNKCCCQTREPLIDRTDFGFYNVRTPLLIAVVP